MDQQIKHEWVANLKSGGVKQCRFRLYKVVEDAHCCLGVLCEMAVEAGIIKKSGDRHIKYGGLGHSLPDAVVEWAKLNSNNPQPKHSGSSLIGLNDGGKTFDEIADIIEKGF